MAKSIKLNNDTYIDGSAIRINRKTILDYIYPIGSIYLSWTNTNPQDLFGGIWEHISDGFLYCIGDTPRQGNLNGSAKTAASTGNTGSHTLTTNEIPSHKHSMAYGPTTSGSNPGWPYGLSQSAGTNSASGKGWNGNIGTFTEGGGQGHTHSLNSHTHNIPFTGVMVWRRTA